MAIDVWETFFIVYIPVLVEISIWNGELCKADGLLQYKWASSDPLKIKPKVRESRNHSPWLLELWPSFHSFDISDSQIFGLPLESVQLGLWLSAFQSVTLKTVHKIVGFLSLHNYVHYYLIIKLSLDMWLPFSLETTVYTVYTLETTVSLVVWLLKVSLGLSLPTCGILSDLFCLCFVLSSSVMVHCHHSFCLSVLIKFTLCCHCLWKVNVESLDKLRRKWSLSPTKSGYILLVIALQWSLWSLYSQGSQN